MDEEIKKLASNPVWGGENVYMGDVTLAALIARHKVLVQVDSVNLEDAEFVPSAHRGGFADAVGQKLNSEERATEIVRLLWWRRGQRGVHFDYFDNGLNVLPNGDLGDIPARGSKEKPGTW